MSFKNKYSSDDYANIQYINSGSHGQIYTAYDKTLKSTIVIKQIKKMKIGNKITNENEILNEVEILTHLSTVCSKNMLCYIDYKEDDDFFYIITEHLGKHILLSKISQLTLSNDDLIKMIENLKIGLYDIHNAGVAHRDIKPDNIMVNPFTMDIKYIDFGLSCLANQCKQGDQGTPLYMAPEILNGHSPNDFDSWKQADYWSLGVTILGIQCDRPFVVYYGNMIKQTPVDDIHELKYVINNGINNKMDNGMDISVFKIHNMMTYPRNKFIHKYLLETVFPLISGKIGKRRLILPF